MLDRAHRLTSSADFSTAVRRGRRAGSRTVVVHLDETREQLDAPAGHTEHASAGGQRRDGAVRVGFVVGRAVGNAVVRNRVRRRLRHLVHDRLPDVPRGSLVVRALPAAALASYVELGRDLDATLGRTVGRQGVRS